MILNNDMKYLNFLDLFPNFVSNPMKIETTSYFKKIIMYKGIFK